MSSSRRIRKEAELVKKRERLHDQEELWKSRQKYYDHWEKKNTKFDEWTSPRYHEQHTKYLYELKTKQTKEENLKIRQDKLRRLLRDEDQANKIEAMMSSLDKIPRHDNRNQGDVIPTEILKNLNKTLRLEEDDRRRHEAEINLYHKWRDTNPTLRHHERMQRGRDLKLSWLDQQIEMRMRQEKEEEECRKILKERNRQMKLLEEREVAERNEREAKKAELKRSLDLQIAQLRTKSDEFDKMKRKETESVTVRENLNRFESSKDDELRRRLAKECALYNIKQHKLKLRLRAKEIEDNLERELELIKQLTDAAVTERIESDRKKREIKDAILEFLAIIRQQKHLEKQRQKHLDFVFDSEAKVIYEQQDDVWRREEASRLTLLDDVIKEIRQQIDANITKSMEQQREKLTERELVLARIDEYNREIESLTVMEKQKKIDRKKELDDDIKVKQAKKFMEKNKTMRKINEDLEDVRKEEERLQNEIIQMQKRQGPYRPVKNRIIY